MAIQRSQLDPSHILESSIAKASLNLQDSLVLDDSIKKNIELVARNTQNRACIRFVLSCALAKVHNPGVDIRKPYTEIGDEDSFSGRTYDERYISEFVARHELPCNSTTAYLTPAFRNQDRVMTPEISLVGRPRNLYQATLQLLDDVYRNRISADTLLQEALRWLLLVRNENRQRMDSLLASLGSTEGETLLSSEGIVSLIQQHLSLRGSSRLPVLVVAAAYISARDNLGENVLPFHSHNAADKQTGSLGDLEIALEDNDSVITSYEMKTRKVTKNDIDQALKKVLEGNMSIDNYIFITTDEIDREVQDYARSMYEKTHGMEVVILDCIGFLRHFLHLFHRLRSTFLETYQDLVLAESDSAVNLALKEAFLSMRQAAESDLYSVD